jgi:para-nitrobenzyl esterase
VFGSDAWQRAPMLGTTPWSAIDQQGRELRRAWTRFAHSGDPNADRSEAWPRHRSGAVPGHRFFARPAS